jgi:hypothetical protein
MKKYRYFTDVPENWGAYVVIAALPDIGTCFRKDGSGIPSEENKIKICIDSKNKEISLNQALAFFNNKEAAQKFLDELGIKLEINSDQKEPELTGAEIKKVVKFLVKKNAFNGDMAYNTRGSHVRMLNNYNYLRFVEKNIIKTSPLDERMIYLVPDYKKFI